MLQEMDEQAREEFFRVKKALASEDFLSGGCHPLFGFFWILQKHELCGEDLKSSADNSLAWQLLLWRPKGIRFESNNPFSWLFFHMDPITPQVLGRMVVKFCW